MKSRQVRKFIQNILNLPNDYQKNCLFYLYIYLFQFTPEICRPYALISPTLRKLMVGFFVNKCGEKIRVKINADISMFIEIGDFSELGTNCIIQSNTFIGKKRYDGS